MEASLLTIILLGIVEGLTEFIPVSSTGHLVLAGELLGFDSAAAGTFEIVIQLGAILAVIVLYWRRFWDVFVGLGRRDLDSIAFTRNIALGFLPSAVVGLIVYDAVKAMPDEPIIVAVALILGGIAILVLERWNRPPTTPSGEAQSWKTAPGIGLIKVLSILPGVGPPAAHTP